MVNWKFWKREQKSEFQKSTAHRQINDPTITLIESSEQTYLQVTCWNPEQTVDAFLKIRKILREEKKKRPPKLPKGAV